MNRKKCTASLEFLFLFHVAGSLIKDPIDRSWTDHSSVPRIVIIYPLNGSTASLPVAFRYTSTSECISEVYIDGISIFKGFHIKEKNFTIEFAAPHLSYENHVVSIDIVDEDGALIEAGIVSHNFNVVEDPIDDYYDEVEPTILYDPNLTDEDKANAVLKDGWLLIHQNIEFTRIEPMDSCEDIGWTERNKARRIYDAFQFFNELDILEIRLHELWNVVHRFILIEATRTHSNQPKPLYYEIHKHRFAQFHSKIVHIIVDDLPNSTDPWVLENFQRNTILRGLSTAHPNDLVVIADVDEIPASYVLDALRRCDGPTSPTWLYSRFFNFKFEWEFLGQWKHPQVVRFANLVPGAPGSVTPQQVRMGAMTPTHTKIESAGWHCSFFSDAAGIIRKVKAFTHQELNRKDWLDADAIASAIRDGTDYFNADMAGRRNSEERHGGLQPNLSCHGLPRHVLQHAHRFRALLPDCAAAHGDDVQLASLASPACIAGSHGRAGVCPA